MHQGLLSRLGSPAGWIAWILVLAALVFATWPAPTLAAGGERYDYDGLGRLVRAVSNTGIVTEYIYDAAGNITAVVRGGAATPPTLTAISPASLRRGSQTRVTLTGTHLQNAALQAIDRELTISGVTRSDSSLAFDLAASTQATLGPSLLRVSSAAGNATIAIQVRPPLPSVELSPLPIAAPPDNRSATVDVVLTGADDQAHTIALSTAHPAIATVSPATLTIPAGATRASIFVTGHATGNTELRLASATLGNLTQPVFILAGFAGINTARALVGVQLESAATVRDFGGVVAAARVGVLRANQAWLDTTPRFVAQGTAQQLRIVGVGLPATLAITATPVDGLAFGPVMVAPDGSSATVTVSAAADAQQGSRRLQVSTASSALMPASQAAGVLEVVAPRPQVESVQPIVLVPGSTVPAFEIRGRNLQDATTVSVTGGGVVTGASLTVNDSGTLLTVGLQVSQVAEAGTRVVVVSGPSGASDALPSPANTVTVASSTAELFSYPSLAAPMVGVLLDAPGPTNNGPTVPVPAPRVGVAVGSFALDVAPATVARTTTQVLRVRGQGLVVGTVLTAHPSTGLLLGAPTFAADGSEITFSVTAAADAPLGPRRLELVVGGRRLPVVSEAGSLILQVTPLAPVLDSVEPATVLASGAPFTFTVRGRNFQDATVRISPAADIALGAPEVNADGTQLQVSMSIGNSAARGPRLVTVVGPATESDPAPGPHNTLSIVDGRALSHFGAPLVGVLLGDLPQPDPKPPANALVAAQRVGVNVGAVQPEGPRNTVNSPAVGLMLEVLPTGTSTGREASAAPAGVLRGPAALSVEPPALVHGQTATLVVRGHALPAGTVIQVAPAAGALLAGTPLVDADGSAVRQAITASAGAPSRLSLTLRQADGRAIPAATAAGATLAVVAGLPDVVSIEPILARQGDTVTLVIRGQRLNDALRVTAEPPAGIDFSSDRSVNAAGTELTLRLFVRDDAAVGARVIRVHNPLGGSSTEASPANTFTVFPKQ